MPTTSPISQPTKSPVRHFVRGSLGAGVAVAARAAGALVVNKLFATYAPAGGLTLLAQFQNLMAMFTTLPNDGVQVGLVKYLAPLRPGSSGICSTRKYTWISGTGGAVPAGGGGGLKSTSRVWYMATGWSS